MNSAYLKKRYDVTSLSTLLVQCAFIPKVQKVRKFVVRCFAWWLRPPYWQQPDIENRRDFCVEIRITFRMLLLEELIKQRGTKQATLGVLDRFLRRLPIEKIVQDHTFFPTVPPLAAFSGGQS